MSEPLSRVKVWRMDVDLEQMEVGSQPGAETAVISMPVLRYLSREQCTLQLCRCRSTRGNQYSRTQLSSDRHRVPSAMANGA